MSAACPLCATDELEAGDVSRRLVDDHWPEGGRPDYLGLKRDLETELGLNLTVTAVERHVDDHIRYSLTTGDLEVTM